MRYRFGEFELDTQAYTLSRAGRALSVRPKVFDVLRVLLERRGRLVTKAELLDALWPGAVVDEAVVPWSMTHLRRLLGQRGHAKDPIETVYKRGYRFRGEVQVIDPAASQPPFVAGTSSQPSSEQSGAPFVGRDDLMRRLRERLDQASAGRGGLCLLVGEPGIGKTRCMDELALVASSLGFEVWSGRAAEHTWAPAFWPWIQVLRCAANDRPALRRQAGVLLARMADVGAKAQGQERAESGPHADRFLLLDELSRFMFSASKGSPLLIALDDLHWADAATLDLLALIAPELRRHPVLVVASQRDQPDGYRVPHPHQLARYAERIDLTPLTKADVGHYIRLVTRAGVPHEALCAAVHGATAGNALFLQETVRALIAQHGASALSSLSPADVKPAQLTRDVLRKRLDILDAGTRGVLATASVLGESLDVRLLPHVCGVPGPVLLDALEAGMRAGFIVTDGPTHHRFHHALVGSVLYDELPVGVRVAAHRRAAEAIERLAHARPRHAELAHHYYRSLALGDSKRVAAAAQRAAEEALRTGEFEDATMFCQWALEAQALDLDTTPRQHAELLLLRARAQRHARRDHDARATISLLLDVASLHGYADLLVQAARVLRPGRAWGAGADPVARAALEEALRITSDELDEHRISALSQLACLPPYALDMQRSKEMTGRALELARKLDKPFAVAEALRARLYALSGPDDIDALLNAAQEMLTLEHQANTQTAIEAHAARYAAFLHRGDLTAADEALAALGRSAHEQQRPEAIWLHDRLRAQRRFVEGDFAGAEASFEELSTRSKRMRLSYSGWLLRIPQAMLAIEREGAAAATAMWDLPALVARAENMAPENCAGMARLAVQVGRKDLARPVLERLSPHDFRGVPKELAYLNTLAALSTVAVALADRPRAECLYRLLAPYPHHNSPTRFMYYGGSVSHFLARLAELLGAHERVRSHFEDALAMNERLGHKVQLTRTCYEYARFLLTHGHGPRKQAEALRLHAEQLATSLGMKAFAAQIRALER